MKCGLCNGHSEYKSIPCDKCREKLLKRFYMDMDEVMKNLQNMGTKIEIRLVKQDRGK